MKITKNLITHPITKNDQITRSNPLNPVYDGTLSQFDQILKDKLALNDQVKFSKHAELRMQARNIDLTQNQREKINSAVSMAQQKGIKDSLVILDNMAFVVNVPSRQS